MKQPLLNLSSRFGDHRALTLEVGITSKRASTAKRKLQSQTQSDITQGFTNGPEVGATFMRAYTAGEDTVKSDCLTESSITKGTIHRPEVGATASEDTTLSDYKTQSDITSGITHGIHAGITFIRASTA